MADHRLADHLRQPLIGGPGLVHTVVGLADLRRQQPRLGGIRCRGVRPNAEEAEGRDRQQHSVQCPLRRLPGQLVLPWREVPDRHGRRFPSLTRRNRLHLPLSTSAEHLYGDLTTKDIALSPRTTTIACDYSSLGEQARSASAEAILYCGLPGRPVDLDRDALRGGTQGSLPCTEPTTEPSGCSRALGSWWARSSSRTGSSKSS